MLDIKIADRDADVATLVCLISVKVTLDEHLAIGNADRLTFSQSYACVSLFPSGSSLRIGVGNDHTATYGEIILLAEAKDDTGGFWPFGILGSWFPTERVAMLDGEANAVWSDDLCFPLLVVEQHGIHVVSPLSIKDQRLCLS